MSPAASPADGTGIVSFEITADGSALPSNYEVVSVDSWCAVNKVPRARITLLDGAPNLQDFPISASATFAPGAAVAIKAGYENKTSPIFSGIVTAQRLEISPAGSPTLVVELADKAVKLTIGRNSTIGSKQKDSDVMSQLVSAAGLSADVTATDTEYETAVQYHATDWDMLVARAEMNGMIVIVQDGKVTVAKPDTSSSPALKVTFGESLLDLSAELDALSQLSDSGVKAQAWDCANQATVEVSAAAPGLTEPGDLSGATLANVAAPAAFTRMTGGFLEQAALQTWADGELLRSRLAKIRGRLRFQGHAAATTGGTIELAGVGARFNGTHFIGAVHHQLRRGRWTTEVELGVRPEWHVDRPGLNGGAAGQLPAVSGLQIGVVMKIDEDPAGESRVQVKLPLTGSDIGIWARLASFYATKSAGAVFYPEVGDEVIVAFMNEDPRYPVVLGSLFSSNRTVPASYAPAAENKLKAIVTRSNLEVSFDDDKKIITIKTPAGQAITVDDDQKLVRIKDVNGHSVTLDNGGITLDSAKDITLTSQGKISLSAVGDVAVKSSGGNVNVEGLQVALKAQTTLSAEGTATAEVKSSGILKVQGSLVQIN